MARVFVATGENFPDALAAGAAAGADDRVLLTKRGSLPVKTAVAIEALAPDEIIVLGSESVVSEAVVEALLPLADTVRRVYGADRYETAALVATLHLPPEEEPEEPPTDPEEPPTDPEEPPEEPEDPVAFALSAVVNGTSVSLAWGAVSGASKYRLRRDGTKIFESQVRAYIDKDLAAGAHNYVLVALDSNNNQIKKATKSVTIAGEQPEEPPEEPEEPGPTPTPTPTGAVGYGKAAIGGGDRSPMAIRTLTEFKAAISGPDRVLDIQTKIDLGAGSYTISQQGLTLLGRGDDIWLFNGWLQPRGPNQVYRNLAVACGDKMPGGDPDAFSNNGAKGPILFDHVLALWSPDVNFTLLNACSEITVQYSVFAEGLYLSSHPEGVEAQGGHSMGLNVSNIAGAGKPYPTKITIYRSALINNADRNGRFMGCDQVDFIENLVYGVKSKGPHGNPRGLNVVNNIYRKGAVDPRDKTPFDVVGSADEPNIYAGSIYLAGNVADGYTFGPLESSPAFRSTPKTPLSVPSTRPPTLEEILGNLGPQPNGAHMRRLIDDVRNRRTVYKNGFGKAAPTIAF